MRRTAIYKHVGFEKVANHYYQEFLIRNPVIATWLGEHSFDGLLPETGAESVERNLSFLREMRDAFLSLPENELSVDEKIDRDLAIHFAESQLFVDEDLQRWKMGKDLAMIIGNSLFLLLTRDFTNIHQRVDSIIMRLKAVPAFLMGSKTIFQKVPELWGEIFIESLTQLPAFIDTILNALKNQISPTQFSKLDSVANQAKKSIAEFKSWFIHAIMPKAVHEWAMGENAFEAYLSLRKTGLKKAEMLEIAEKAREQAKIQLEILSQKILGKTTGAASGARIEALKKIKKHCPPNFDIALAAYREAINRCRDFVIKSDFATLPDNEELEIIETPDFMAHLIPFSAYIAPERTSNIQKGTYLLTRDKKGNNSRYNYAEITNSALHEGYPGHHLQLTGQNLHPGKMRIFAESLELIKGWAHYCEEQFKEREFYQGNNELFAQALNQLFNATRMKIDINLHTRKWTFDQAIYWLIEEVGLDRTSAEAEIRRYAQYPAAQIGYTIGKELLLDLKQSLKNQFSADFNEKNFHDLIIYEGSLPIALGRKYYSEIMKTELRAQNRA